MAETRKYDPSVGNAIAQALRQALGDPVLPSVPGEDPATAHGPDAEQPEIATTWLTISFEGDSSPSSADEGS